MSGTSAAGLVTGLDFCFSFVFLVFIIVMYRRIETVIESSQRKIVSAADYTVFVRHLPRGTLFDLVLRQIHRCEFIGGMQLKLHMCVVVILLIRSGKCRCLIRDVVCCPCDHLLVAYQLLLQLLCPLGGEPFSLRFSFAQMPRRLRFVNILRSCSDWTSRTSTRARAALRL